MGGIVGGSGTTVSGPAGSAGSAINSFLPNIVSFVANDLPGLFKTIRDNAKAKKALAIANAGGYNTLTPYQKSLIGNYQGEIGTNPDASLLSVNGVLLVGALVIGAIGLLIWLFKKH